ncbi:hypothetical protein [Methanonatronarchaeum sp. AMET-Sl]|uniref:hypothetical protein n=1 Tax=Methanonatronarchaeum sp. AMET-Sl TaxID=3037654 RepID=UPI00244E09DD|nr:hypothetical protein [Methanonatronarchaeum sp. AMET-Sl]WGI17644.1 hypothetical protein QEN48_01145 [Methanonatronarchaeum sp. AMET-Sl]
MEDLGLPIKLILKKRAFGGWFDIAERSIEILREKGGMFHLRGHSWSIDKRNNWQKLERILKKLSEIEDTTYVNNAELIRYL